jgi:hypothetical protein
LTSAIADRAAVAGARTLALGAGRASRRAVLAGSAGFAGSGALAAASRLPRDCWSSAGEDGISCGAWKASSTSTTTGEPGGLSAIRMKA